MKTIQTEDIRIMLDNGQKFTLINVLGKEQFRETRLPEAINIPLDDPHFLDRVENATGGKDEKIVVYCASRQCDASEKAWHRLSAAGFTNVYDYEGGAKAWKEAGLKMEPISMAYTE